MYTDKKLSGAWPRDYPLLCFAVPKEPTPPGSLTGSRPVVCLSGWMVCRTVLGFQWVTVSSLWRIFQGTVQLCIQETKQGSRMPQEVGALFWLWCALGAKNSAWALCDLKSRRFGCGHPLVPLFQFLAIVSSLISQTAFLGNLVSLFN